MKTTISIVLFSISLFAFSANDIIKNVQHNIQSDSGYSNVTMVVTTSRGDRTMKMESWNRGNEKSFIKILYPKQDNGITFLKIDTTMWQYVPKIEKTIKIPSSMMMQSWMGSDFTNDDMSKESSIVDDYIPTITSEGAQNYTLTLIPKLDAPVVWGKIIMTIQKEHFIPLKAVYFDEDGKQKRILEYSDIKIVGTRYFPAVMTLIPSDKENNKTVVTMDEINFDTPIEDSRFTMSALKRYSR